MKRDLRVARIRQARLLLQTQAAHPAIAGLHKKSVALLREALAGDPLNDDETMARVLAESDAIRVLI